MTTTMSTGMDTSAMRISRPGRRVRGGIGGPSRSVLLRSFLLLAVSVTTLGWPTVAGAASPVSELRPLVLSDGVNTIPGFMPDGSAATIVQAWRGNGNAHGYHDWLVLAPTGEGHGAAVVTLNDPDLKEGLESLVSDSPFEGEHVIRSVRFAFGTVDGRPASLMLQATRSDFSTQSLVDPAIATVRVFRLVQTDGDPGESPFEFRLVWQAIAEKRYCHADLALRDVLGVPLPRDFEGVNRIDGCYPR